MPAFKVTSNAQSVLSAMQKAVQEQLQDNKLARLAAFDTQASIQNRVQQFGENTAGEKMRSYSLNYERYRQAKGRQTSIRDLTLTGDMFQDWGIAPIGSNAWGVGFFSQLQADKAKLNEMREGVIFELSPDEQQIVVQTLNENANLI